MASPSRSGSGASSTFWTWAAASLISASTFCFVSMTTYSGSNVPCSMSMPIFFFGRSFTWPTDAFTT
jgi:hypothetical protein